jgi:hypothetical protein
MAEDDRTFAEHWLSTINALTALELAKRGKTHERDTGWDQQGREMGAKNGSETENGREQIVQKENTAQSAQQPSTRPQDSGGDSAERAGAIDFERKRGDGQGFSSDGPEEEVRARESGGRLD